MKLPPPLRSLYKDTNQNLSSEDFELLKEATIAELRQTPSHQFVYVEEATRNQSQCFAWYEQRAGRITGSTVHLLYRGRIDSPARSVVTRICSDKKKTINAAAINHGRKHEIDALELYKKVSANPDFFSGNLSVSLDIVHKNFELQSIGLVISDKTPWLAASPDGCVFCTCCGFGVVEVKCPYSMKDKPLIDEIKAGNFYVGRKSDSSFYLEESHEYFYQVQLEMYCTGTSYCDLVVWTPKEHLIVRVNRDDDFIDNLTITCSNYWVEVILRELLLRTFELEDEAHAADLDDDSIRTCKKCHSQNDDMMKCCKCNYYFHPKCVGRNSFETSMELQIM